MPPAQLAGLTDGRFNSEDGRARLIVTKWEPFPEQPTAEYPFVLNTGRTVEYEAALLEDLDWLGFVPDVYPTAAFRAGPCESRQTLPL